MSGHDTGLVRVDVSEAIDPDRWVGDFRRISTRVAVTGAIGRALLAGTKRTTGDLACAGGSRKVTAVMAFLAAQEERVRTAAASAHRPRNLSSFGSTPSSLSA